MVCAAATLTAADASARAFRKEWEGRRVVIQRALFTLVYDEIGRVGITRRGRRAGLTVVTPSRGVYFQFDGRGEQDDLSDPDPNRLLTMVSERYRRSMHLEIGNTQSIQPQHLIQYAPGGEMVVTRVHIERDRVRVQLAKGGAEGDEEFATTLTVRWPVPFSRDFPEAVAIGSMVRQFLAPVVVF